MIYINDSSSLEESLRLRVPQSLDLGQLLFGSKMISRTCRLLSHSYAADNPIYSSCKHEQTATLNMLKSRTEGCIIYGEDEFMWVASRKIQHLIDHSAIDSVGTESVPPHCLKLLGIHINVSSLRSARL